MTLARNRVRNVTALGPLSLASNGGDIEGVAVKLGGRGFEVAMALRDLGCNVEFATALDMTTFVGRYAVREVRGRGLGTSYMVHDGALGDLGICTNGGWGESEELSGVLASMLAGRGWLVCDGGLGRAGLDTVSLVVSDGELKAVGMGSGREAAALACNAGGWRGLCLDRPGWWAALGGDGRVPDGDCQALSGKLGGVVLRVEASSGVSLTLRKGTVLSYGVWRGLAEETAGLTDWLMGGA